MAGKTGSIGRNRQISADKLSFSGHAKEKLSLSRSGDDLVFKSLGSSDQVTIDGWYEQGGGRRLERIESGTEVLLAPAPGCLDDGQSWACLRLDPHLYQQTLIQKVWPPARAGNVYAMRCPSLPPRRAGAAYA